MPCCIPVAEKALRQRAAGAVGCQRVCMHQWAVLRGYRWGTGSTFFKGPTWSNFCPIPSTPVTSPPITPLPTPATQASFWLCLKHIMHDFTHHRTFALAATMPKCSSTRYLHVSHLTFFRGFYLNIISSARLPGKTDGTLQLEQAEESLIKYYYKKWTGFGETRNGGESRWD